MSRYGQHLSVEEAIAAADPGGDPGNAMEVRLAHHGGTTRVTWAELEDFIRRSDRRYWERHWANYDLVVWGAGTGYRIHVSPAGEVKQPIRFQAVRARRGTEQMVILTAEQFDELTRQAARGR